MVQRYSSAVCSVAQMGSEELIKVHLSHRVQGFSVVSAPACFTAGFYSISRQGTPWRYFFLNEQVMRKARRPRLLKSVCRNTGEKISPESAFLRLVNCASPASAFRHQAHSGTAGHVLVRHCPAMSISV